MRSIRMRASNRKYRELAPEGKARRARTKDLGMGRVGQLPPGDELDVLFLKQLAKFGAGEKIEIALTPGSTPGVALTRCGFHFVIGESDVDDEFGDAGLKISQRGLVELRPFFRRNGGSDGNGVIENDISGSQTGFQIGLFLEPVSRNEKRKLVSMRNAKKHFEKVLTDRKSTRLNSSHTVISYAVFCLKKKKKKNKK